MIKLIDILNITCENENIQVRDFDENILSVYDGKSSIDTKYNDCEIIQISQIKAVNGNTYIVYYIKTEE